MGIAIYQSKALFKASEFLENKLKSLVKSRCICRSNGEFLTGTGTVGHGTFTRYYIGTVYLAAYRCEVPNLVYTVYTHSLQYVGSPVSSHTCLYAIAGMSIAK